MNDEHFLIYALKYFKLPSSLLVVVHTAVVYLCITHNRINEVLRNTVALLWFFLFVLI